MYDFDAFIDREGTGSVKWAQRPETLRRAGAVPLSIADMEFRCPPEVTQAVRKAAEHGIYGYTHADDAYFDALAGFMARRHGLEIKREWLLVFNGVVSALGSAVRALSSPGAGVIIQPPVYAPFFDAVEANGGKILLNPLLARGGRYEIDFEGFEKLCAAGEAKLFILCSPHNPVGRVWARGELARLARICAEHGVLILSDEIHADIVFAGRRHTSMLAIPEAEGNCAVFMAMSKTFNLAGLACSEAFAPDPAICGKLARQQRRDNALGMTYFARAASIAAHTDCDGWLDALLPYLAGNFAFLRDFVSQRLPMLRLSPLEGTYLAWMDLRALGLPDKELRGFLAEKAHLALTPGDWFGPGGSGFARWNIALPRGILAEALERLAGAVDEIYRERDAV